MAGRETSAEIDEAAAGWAVRLDAAPLDASEQEALDRWLDGDIRRLGAFARARAVFAHGRRAKALGADFDPDAYLADHHDQPRADRRASWRRPRLTRRAALFGGSGALAVAALGFAWPAAAQTYSTRRGEIRLVPLADGSTMTLNTASTARVRFTEQERRIELIDGEALFDVAHNPARPFVVSAGETKVRATGTSFTVSHLDDRPVQILVRQGSVEIAGGNQPPSRAGANSRAIVRGARPVAIVAVMPADVVRELTWREGMLAFEDRPLRDAAEQFARYSDLQIRFADPAIGAETVTGLFAANNPAAFARAAAVSLGLHAELAGGVVTLSRAG